MIKNSNNHNIRPGCIDMWNAFMVDGAEFTIESDMPICPCTATTFPSNLISYVEAKKLHKRHFKSNSAYHIDAFVHFYIDDQKFDGPREGIWSNPNSALEVIRHFSGAITPDFSTYADFPDPLKRYNTYRTRAFGRWLTTYGIPVINNIRWGTEETWNYCFDGIPYNSIVAIGTVASGLRKLENRPSFEKGFFKMIDVIHPCMIIIYGSANYTCFTTPYIRNIPVISFPSQTKLAFLSRKRGDPNE